MKKYRINKTTSAIIVEKHAILLETIRNLPKTSINFGNLYVNDWKW